MRILLIDTDPVLGHFLSSELRKNGFDADWFQMIEHGSVALRLVPYSAIILSLTLSDSDEIGLLSLWRGRQLKTPFLVLTGRNCAHNRAQILNFGADDCIEKPVVPEELIARLHSVIRRSNRVVDPVLRYGDITMDTDSRIVMVRGECIALTARETSLLEIFLLKHKRVLSRHYLEEQFCCWGREISSNTIEVHIHNLRQKLGKHVIQTVRGQGYRLNGNSTESLTHSDDRLMEVSEFRTNTKFRKG